MTENICPYLGSVSDPMSCTTHASEDNLCYATGEGEGISNAHQKKFCLGGKLTQCSRFPSEPALDILSEAKPSLPAFVEDDSELVEELDDVFVREQTLFEDLDEDDEDYDEEYDEDYLEEEDEIEEPDYAFEKIAAEADASHVEEESFSEVLLSRSLQEDLEQGFVAPAAADDFYFADIDKRGINEEPLGSPPDGSTIQQQAERDVRQSAVNSGDNQRSTVVSQETLAGQRLSFTNESSGDRSESQFTKAAKEILPAADNGWTQEIETFSRSEEPPNFVYDPTVVLPVIRPDQAVPDPSRSAARSPVKGLPEPPIVATSRDRQLNNGLKSQKQQAGVDPNWVARHTATQAALNVDFYPGGTIARMPTGSTPETILRPTQIQGPARPIAKTATSFEPVPERVPTQGAAKRPRTFLFLSLVTTVLALGLVCGGSFLVYSNLLASDKGVGGALVGLPVESGDLLSTSTGDAEAGSSTDEPDLALTEEPSLKLPLR